MDECCALFKVPPKIIISVRYNMDYAINFFYTVIGLLYLVYFFLLYRSYKRGFLFTFVNMSVLYYFIFYVVPYDVIVSGQNYDHASFTPAYYWMSFYYSVLVVSAGIFYNIALFSGGVCPLGNRKIRLTTSDARVVKDRHVAFFVVIKILLLLFGFTPFQIALFYGDFSGAHILQKEMHTTSGYNALGLFYGFVGPVTAVVFIVRACTTRNHIYRIFLLLAAVETAGWYFSKSRFAVALLTFFILYFWSSRINIFALASVLASIVYVAFSFRLGGVVDYLYVWDVFLSRVVSETGYSLIHLDLINQANPPLAFSDRYYLGFRTLFGIEPAGDWSREAYYLETGREGATSSGYAPIYLYAFWGWYWVIVAPILLLFICRVDAFLAKKVARADFIRASYVFISLSIVNAVTVNLTRVIDYRFIINPNLLITVAFFAIVYFSLTRKRAKNLGV